MEKSVNKNEQYIQEVERIALVEYKAVKFGEDQYVLPTNIVNTNLIENEDFKNSEFYKNEELKSLINNLQVTEGEFISVSCRAFDENGRVIVDISNINDLEKVDSISLHSKFEHEDRENLVMMIADGIKNTKDVHISFYIGCNFEEIENLVVD